MQQVFKDVENKVRELEKNLENYSLTESERNDIVYYLAVIKLSVLPRLNKKREDDSLEM